MEKKGKTEKPVNVSLGIDSIARSYLAVHAKGVTIRMDYGKKTFNESEVYGRTSTTRAVELKRYPMKDGSYAEEFVQAVVKCQEGHMLHFIGLSVHDRTLIWPTAKISEKLISNSCSNWESPLY